MYIMPGDLDKLAFGKRDEDTWLAGSSGWHSPNISGTQNGGILTYISRMDTAYVREKTTPKIAEHKVQDSSILGTWSFWWWQHTTLQILEVGPLLHLKHNIGAPWPKVPGGIEGLDHKQQSYTKVEWRCLGS